MSTPGNAATVFWIPLRTYQYIVRHSSSGAGPGDTATSPLGDLSLSLLLVLAHYPAHHAQLRNGVREGLQALQDTSGPQDAEGGHSLPSPAAAAAASSGNPTASFARLYDFFATGVWGGLMQEYGTLVQRNIMLCTPLACSAGRVMC